jgi:hypothetical protein
VWRFSCFVYGVERTARVDETFVVQHSKRRGVLKDGFWVELSIPREWAVIWFLAFVGILCSITALIECFFENHEYTHTIFINLAAIPTQATCACLTINLP